MPYQPARNAPYGNIYSIDTPHIDQLNNLMFQEQRQRQAKQEQEAVELDKQMQQEIGKIRSADIPVAIDAYQKYKTAQKELLFDKRLQRDPQRFAEKQRETNLLKADAFGVVGESKEQKERLANQQKNWSAHPELHDDNTPQWLSMANQTPSRGLKTAMWNGQPLDLSSDDTFTYKGRKMDLNKLRKDASGEAQDVHSERKPLDKDGLQEEVTVYKYGNTPTFRKNFYVNQFGLQGGGREAAYLLKSTPPEEIQRVFKEYDSLPEIELKRRGLPSKQDIMPKNPENAVDVVTSFLAARDILDEKPTQLAPKRETNAAVKTKMDQAWDLKMADHNANLRERAVRLNAALKEQNGGNESDTYDVVDDLFEDAKSNPREYISNGKKTTQYAAKVTPEIKKLFAFTYDNKDGKSITVEPDEVRFSEDGKYVTPIFYKYDDKGQPIRKGSGYTHVDAELSKPVLTNLLRSNQGKKNFGVKENKAIMSGKQGSAAPKTKYTLDGKQYSKSELNKYYSDEEIDQAIKAGLIK